MNEEIKFTEEEQQMINSALMAIGGTLLSKLNDKCKNAEIKGTIKLEDTGQEIEFRIAAK